MTALASLLLDLGQAGVELATDPSVPGRLRYRPATRAKGMVDRLRTHKPAILRLLASGPNIVSSDDSEAAYIFRERLGVADELEMPTHPGSSAWLLALGESMLNSCYMATDAVW